MSSSTRYKYRKCCAVATCISSSSRVTDGDENIRFFSFPKDPKLRNEWIKRCHRYEDFNVDNSKVCHKHFVLDDFEDGVASKLLNVLPKRLKKGVVPTLLGQAINSGKPGCQNFIEAMHKRKKLKAKKTALTDHLLLSSKEVIPSNQEEDNLEKCSYIEPEETHKDRCFVCDKLLQDYVEFSREIVAQVLRKILGDGFFMVIKEEDYLCRTCQDVVLRIPDLEKQLRTATLALRALLRLKYSLDFPPVAEGSKETTYQMPVRKLQNHLIARHKPVQTSPVHDLKEVELETSSFIVVNTDNVLENYLEGEERQMYLRERQLEKDSNTTGDEHVPCSTNHVEEIDETFVDSDFEENKESLDRITSEGLNGETSALENKAVKVFKCGMCAFKSSTDEEMKSHYLQFGKKDGYYCNICDVSFHKKNLLRNHKVNHSSVNQRRRCVFCRQFVHDRLHMKFHIREKHKKQSSLHTCTHCNKVFQYLNSLKQHLFRHHNVGNTFTCDKCDTQFRDKIKFTKHVNYSHRHPLVCKCCNKLFTDVDKLCAHERNRRPRLFHKCRFCPMKFRRLVNLAAHEEQHCERFKYVCHKCDFGFNELEDFEDHRAKDNCSKPAWSVKYKALPMMCDICGKLYTTVHSFRRHRAFHEDPCLFECDICFRKFLTKMKRDRHKLRFHKHLSVGKKKQILTEIKTFV